MTKRRRAPQALLFDAMATGVATWTTLSVRVPQLILGTMRPAERRRMVAEKVNAATRGALADAQALATVAARRGSKASLPTIADTVSIVEAATRPARTCVKANAARLATKPSSKRKSRS